MKAFLDENFKHVTQKYQKGDLSDIQRNIGSAQLPLSQMVIDGRIPHFSDVLDIACGAGQNSIMLALNHMNVVSFDIMDEVLLKAQDFFRGHNLDIQLFKADLLKMPFLDNSFDIALDSFIYHDLKPDARIPYIQEVYRVLKPGGKFIFFSFSDYMEKKTGPGPERISSRIIHDTILQYFDCEELRIFDNFPTINKPNQKHWFGVFQKPLRKGAGPKAFMNKKPIRPIRGKFHSDIIGKLRCTKCGGNIHLNIKHELQCSLCDYVFEESLEIPSFL